MMQHITIGNRDLIEFGVLFDGSEWWRIPARDIEEITVPGRSGNYIIDGGRYNNITIPIDFYIHKHFQRNYSALISYLMTLKGYQRIESTEEPNVFRMGFVTGRIEPNTGAFNRSGRFTVNINFKPQKWLKTGEATIKVTDGMQISNPTGFRALPLILVEGTGTIQVGSVSATLSANTGTTVIDCESMNAYEPITNINRNPDLTLSGDTFPYLDAGTTGISYTGFTSVKLIPKWWKL